MPNTRLPSEKLVELLMGIAGLGNPKAYAIYKAMGQPKYRPIETRVTHEIVRRHLSNEQPIGCYFVLGTETYVGVIDCDDHDGSMDWNDMAAAGKAIVEKLRIYGITAQCFRSGGGSGLHIWIFWETPQDASLVMRFLKAVVEECGYKNGTAGGIQSGVVEVFPKNRQVKEGSLGNLIALPLARDSVALDESLQPIEWNQYDPPALGTLFSPPVEEVFAPQTPLNSNAQRHSQKNSYSKLSSDLLPGDEEEVRAALKFVDSDDYQPWIRIAFALKHSFGDDGFAIFDEWSSKSEKYEGKDACRTVWDGLTPDGSLTVGTIFHLARVQGWNGPTDPDIREMNTRYGILTHGGSTRIILKQKVDGGQGPISWLSKTSFEDRLAGERIQVEYGDGSSRKVSRAKHWLNHARAAHYYEIIFDPSLPPGHNGNRWNMWAGFAVQPAPGKWDLLQEHIYTNICGGNDENYQWMLNWMAEGVQNPGEVIGTAPVLYGLPGTGKGVLANAYGRLWGDHYVSVTKEDHITGRFNQHFLGKRFVYIDEGMFGGDRRNAGVVKTMITEPRVMLEAKGMDPFFMENHMIFMVTSNERSIVAADIGDRRWQVLPVGDKHREDRPYFAAIIAQLDEGGIEGMLCDLLKRDISIGPDPRRTIRTPELFDQIIQAQGPIEKYLYQLLDEGQLPQPDAPGNRAGVTTIAAMLDQMKRTQPRANYVQLPIFGRILTELFPDAEKTQSGNFIVGRDANGRVRTERSMRYQFPPLQQCRRLFSAYIGQDIPWSNDLEEWQGDEFDGPYKDVDYPF